MTYRVGVCPTTLFINKLNGSYSTVTFFFFASLLVLTMAESKEIEEINSNVAVCNANEMYNGIQISFCTLTVSFDSTADYQQTHITDSINIPFDTTLGDNIDENEIEKQLISYIKASKGYIRYIFFYSYSIDNMDQYIEKIQKIVIKKLIPSDEVSKEATYFKLDTNEYKKFESKFPFLCRTNKQSTNPFLCIDADDVFKEVIGHETTFDLEQVNGKTRIRFSQSGFSEKNDLYAGINYSWGKYLESLRQYLQTGIGEGFGTEKYRS